LVKEGAFNTVRFDADPDLIGNYAETETLIQDLAVPIPYETGNEDEGPGNVPNHATGWGEIDALAAVQAALGVSSTPIATSTSTSTATATSTSTKTATSTVTETPTPTATETGTQMPTPTTTHTPTLTETEEFPKGNDVFLPMIFH